MLFSLKKKEILIYVTSMKRHYAPNEMKPVTRKQIPCDSTDMIPGVVQYHKDRSYNAGCQEGLGKTEWRVSV